MRISILVASITKPARGTALQGTRETISFPAEGWVERVVGGSESASGRNANTRATKTRRLELPADHAGKVAYCIRTNPVWPTV